MGQKKTRKLLKKILHSEKKRSLYSQGELLYMERHLELMKLAHAKKKLTKKGFGTTNE